MTRYIDWHRGPVGLFVQVQRPRLVLAVEAESHALIIGARWPRQWTLTLRLLVVTAMLRVRTGREPRYTVDYGDDLFGPVKITRNGRSWRWTKRAERIGGVLTVVGLIVGTWALLWLLAPVQR